MSFEIQSQQVYSQESRLVILALLSQNTPVTFQARGPSMNPTIRDGEVVRVRPAQPDDIRKGAVLFYPMHDRLVLHRMVARRKINGIDSVVTVGDAAVSSEEHLPAAEVIGVAEWVKRGEKIHRLDRIIDRLYGRGRFLLRPMRRMVVHWYHRHHADTPAS